MSSHCSERNVPLQHYYCARALGYRIDMAGRLQFIVTKSTTLNAYYVLVRRSGEREWQHRNTCTACQINKNYVFGWLDAMPSQGQVPWTDASLITVTSHECRGFQFTGNWMDCKRIIWNVASAPVQHNDCELYCYMQNSVKKTTVGSNYSRLT